MIDIVEFVERQYDIKLLNYQKEALRRDYQAYLDEGHKFTIQWARGRNDLRMLQYITFISLLSKEIENLEELK